MTSRFIGVYAAVDRIRRGGMVVVMDSEDRENEADLVMAGEFATAEAIAFMIRGAGGLICVPCAPEVTTRLDIPLMVPEHAATDETAFGLSVDHRSTGSGISARDRATTIRALADPKACPDDFRRPGHVFPLRARLGGVLERPGHTEAAVDLMLLAGLRPVGIVCEVLGDDGEPLRGTDLAGFAVRHALRVLSIEVLADHLARGDGGRASPATRASRHIA